MTRKRILCLLAAAVCAVSCSLQVTAAEVECDTIYCFTNEDFDTEADPLAGICITGLPDANTGTLLLGVRVLRRGDILTADQLAQVTFSPVRTQTDTHAVLTYLPIYESRVAPSTTMTIAIRGKEDKAPTAEDMAVETYKNLPNEGKLKVNDPEGQGLTYTVLRQPRRGSVELRNDGTFVYTPKKNKVGVDSFTFTAADPAGNVSREATVTVQILKPSQSAQYTDTLGLDCRFEAEWLRNTGLFAAEQVGGVDCFQPQKAVSKGEFLAMAILLQIPTQEESSASAMNGDEPVWLRPYLNAALQSGLLAGLPETETVDYDAPVTGAEAAVLLQNALDLPQVMQVTESEAAEDAEEDVEDLPTWADSALAVMQAQGLQLSYDVPLTRAAAAELLYQISGMAESAPGTSVFRLQQ